MTTKITRIVTIVGIVIGLFGALYLIFTTLPKTRGRDDKECSIASTGGCAVAISYNEEAIKLAYEVIAEQQANIKQMQYENKVNSMIANPPSFK